MKWSNIKSLLISLFLLTSLLISSAEAQTNSKKDTKDNPFRNLPDRNTPRNPNPFKNTGKWKNKDKKKDNSRSGPGFTAELRPGDKLIIGKKKLNKLKASAEEVVENFQYPKADILDVTKAIAKLTGKNFIYNPQDIKGKISIVSETPVTTQSAWRAFLTALDMKGYTILPSGDYLRIEKKLSAKEKTVPIYTGKSTINTDQYITRIISLKYINAKDVEKTFRLWFPRDARIYAYEQTNTLIITDTATHINSFMELMRVLDVQGFQESLTVIPVKYAIAKDIAVIIQEIIAQETGSTRFSRRPVRRGSTSRDKRFQKSRKGGGSSISKILADERTNSLIVKANVTGLQEIRELVKKLDTKIAAAEGTGKIHVYRLEFADAETLATSLGAIAKDNQSSSLNRFRRSRLRTIPNRRATRRGGPVVASIFEGNIKISADKTTQSLIITASPQDYSTIKRVIQQLDIPRDQVYVEAVIMEVQLRKEKSSGISFVNPDTGVSFPSENLLAILGGSPPTPGFSLGFGKSRSLKIGDLEVNTRAGLLELLRSQGSANIIATPHITAMDNETAEVEIKETVPVPVTTQTTTGTERGFRNEDATISLKVTPHINKASNFVRLKVEQRLGEFSDAFVPSEVKGEATGKSTRITKTTINVHDGDTVVMSGLIRARSSETENKIPVLGDIPVLGWLFKNSKIQKTKTDLLLFITPHIIKKYRKNRQILSNRLKERKQFIEENLYGEDPHAQSISKLKKNLPDISKIKETTPPAYLEQNKIPDFQNNPKAWQEKRKSLEPTWSEEELSKEELTEEEEYKNEAELEKEERAEDEVPEAGVQL